MDALFRVLGAIARWFAAWFMLAARLGKIESDIADIKVQLGTMSAWTLNLSAMVSRAMERLLPGEADKAFVAEFPALHHKMIDDALRVEQKENNPLPPQELDRLTELWKFVDEGGRLTREEAQEMIDLAQKMKAGREEKKDAGWLGALALAALGALALWAASDDD